MSMFPIQVAAEAAVLAAVPREAFGGISFVKIDDKSTWRINFSETATKAERDAAEAALAGFDPTTVKPPRRVDFEDALDRLTDQEWSDLQSAIAGNVRLARWYERAKTRGSIDLSDPEVKTALAAVVGAGLFTKQRLSTIFAEAVE
jgi:hypothetical protein